MADAAPLTRVERRRRRVQRRRRIVSVVVIVAFAAGLILWVRGRDNGQAQASPEAPPSSYPSAADVTRCTRVPAAWMGCLSRAHPAFAKLPISALVLPGARDAGTFNLDAQAFDTERGSACSNFTPSDVHTAAPRARFDAAQNQDITQQLDLGVRVLDFQVAYNGNGDPLRGWRIVNTQYSQWPLYDYLDQAAEWAKEHPSEVVIVDIRRVCYDKHPDDAIERGLLQSFVTPSDIERGTTTIAHVAYDVGEDSRTVASTSLRQIVEQRGGGHNVIVLLPDAVRGHDRLASVAKFRAAITTSSSAHSTELPVTRTATGVTPIAGAAFRAASSRLEHAPAPTLRGGTALSTVVLGYTFDPAQRDELYARFGGLARSVAGTRPAPWERVLWRPTDATVTSRNQIVAAWGHRFGIVLADGVENAAFVPAVIRQNAR